jgi:hypothetical protein
MDMLGQAAVVLVVRKREQRLEQLGVKDGDE